VYERTNGQDKTIYLTQKERHNYCYRNANEDKPIIHMRCMASHFIFIPNMEDSS